jgi:hypothetical protein
MTACAEGTMADSYSSNQHLPAKINLCLPWHEGSCDAAQSLSLQADQQEDRRDSEDDKETWSGLPEEVVEEDVGHGGVKVVVNWMPLLVVIPVIVYRILETKLRLEGKLFEIINFAV